MEQAGHGPLTEVPASVLPLVVLVLKYGREQPDEGCSDLDPQAPYVR